MNRETYIISINAQQIVIRRYEYLLNLQTIPNQKQLLSGDKIHGSHAGPV